MTMAFGPAPKTPGGFGWIPRRDKANMGGDDVENGDSVKENTRLLREALADVAPAARHAIVIGEALRNGGLLDVPSETAAFRTFIRGPLAVAADSQLGKDASKKLLTALLEQLAPGTTTLSGTLPLNASAPAIPQGSGPAGAAKGGATLAYGSHKIQRDKASAESTLPYCGDGTRETFDVALIESDAALAKAVTEVLERRSYRVLCPTVAKLEALCRQVPIRLVFVGMEHQRVLTKVSTLGTHAPTVVYLSDDKAARPRGVLAILPRDADRLVELIEALDTAFRIDK